MAKILFSVLSVTLLVASAGHSYIRDYSKAEYSWNSKSNTAYVSGKVIFEDNTEVINFFIIDFNEKHGCKPVFKVSFMDSFEYGELLETIPMDSGYLRLYVDNQLIYDGPIVNVVYSNGTEFGASVSPEMLIRISSGKIITVELVGKMDIIFNLNNAKMNIGSAQKNCTQD